MPKISMTIVDRIETFVASWRELAADATFAGMTLAEFEVAVSAPLVLRAEIVALEKQLEGKKIGKSDADLAANGVLDLVVNSVRGTPQHGPDSSLYRALGYIRKSERRSGLTRKGLEKSPGANAA